MKLRLHILLSVLFCVIPLEGWAQDNPLIGGVSTNPDDSRLGGTPVPPKIAHEMNRVLKGFFACSDPQEMIPFLVHGELLKDQINAYYARDGVSRLIPHSKRWSMTKFVAKGGRKYITTDLRYQGGVVGRVYLEPSSERPRTLLIDWESLVGYCSEPWSAILAGTVAEASVRVEAKAIDTYCDRFPAKDYVAVGLTHLHREGQVVAYVRRDTPLETTLRGRLLRNGQAKPLGVAMSLRLKAGGVKAFGKYEVVETLSGSWHIARTAEEALSKAQ